MVILPFKLGYYATIEPEWTERVLQGINDYHQNGGSFADTDFYKFPMGQVIWKWFRHIGVKFQLILRDPLVIPEGFVEELQRRISAFADKNYKLETQHGEFLKRLPYTDDDYIDYLMSDVPKIVSSDVQISADGGVSMTISGPWHRVSWWEIHAMKIFCQLYYEMTGVEPDGTSWMGDTYQAAREMKEAGAPFAEFVTRRRYDFDHQAGQLAIMIAGGLKKGPTDGGGLIGTSNVYLAELMGIKAIGTIAHEMYMILGAVYGYDVANPLVTAVWLAEYGDQYPGYYLADTYGSELFFEQLGKPVAQYFEGGREDSGRSEVYSDRQIAFMRSHGLTPKQIRHKSVIHSNALPNPQRVKELLVYDRQQGIRASFGIGGMFKKLLSLHYTSEPQREVQDINIVIKPIEAWLLDDPSRTSPCIKISDSNGKVSGDPKAIAQFFHWRETGEVLWTPLASELPIEITSVKRQMKF